MLAAETDNKIPKNNGVIKSALRSKQTESKVDECIIEIKNNFPKFKENKGFYYFQEWDNRCNWINNRELRRNSAGTPQDGADKKDIDIEKIRRIIDTFIAKKAFPVLQPDGTKDKVLESSIYARNVRVAKDLIRISKGNIDKVIEIMEWTATELNKKGLNWNLNTVLKWYPEYLVKGNPETARTLGLDNFILKKKGEIK